MRERERGRELTGCGKAARSASSTPPAAPRTALPRGNLALTVLRLALTVLYMAVTVLYMVVTVLYGYPLPSGWSIWPWVLSPQQWINPYESTAHVWKSPVDTCGQKHATFQTSRRPTRTVSRRHVPQHAPVRHRHRRLLYNGSGETRTSRPRTFGRVLSTPANETRSLFFIDNLLVRIHVIIEIIW